MSATVCYYCGVNLTKGNKTNEHIPPKMLFKAFDCIPVTVPSCRAHNLDKSTVDQDMISGYLQPIYEEKEVYRRAHPMVQRAVDFEASRSTFESTKNRVQMVTAPIALGHHRKVAQVSLKIGPWIKQLTAGWVFDAAKTYDNTMVWRSAVSSDSYMKGVPVQNEHDYKMRQARDLEAVEWLKTLKYYDGWSSPFPNNYPPAIYRFKVSVDLSDWVTFQHIFYGMYYWFVSFECSEATKQAIYAKCLK